MPRARRKRILWSTAELKLLRNLAGRESAWRIARKLKRSLQAVRFKAHANRISLEALRLSPTAPTRASPQRWLASPQRLAAGLLPKPR